MKTVAQSTRRARGFVLLEGLVAMVIFSVGVLGMIAMQAVSAKQSTDARYRTEAVLLINQLIGQMWVADRTTSNLQTKFNTGGASYNTWLNSVATTLPGVVANTTTAPSVTIDSQGVATVAVYWLAPSEPQGTIPHNLTTIAQIR